MAQQEKEKRGDIAKREKRKGEKEREREAVQQPDTLTTHGVHFVDEDDRGRVVPGRVKERRHLPGNAHRHHGKGTGVKERDKKKDRV